ncbi:MAG: hypothetical protein K8S62_02250 [Candidatus Sabulitectum sp.]|nr:hypothetical protein [Candidatus Sabulitectum sp.]
MASKEKSVSARLMVFSGRLDPEWELSEDLTQELSKRLAGILKNNEQVEAPNTGILGYKGFLIRNTGGFPDLPAEFSVFKGVVSTGDKGKHIHMRDSQNIEDLLLSDAISRDMGKFIEDVATPER